MEIPTFQPSAFAWKWIMIINNKLSISRFTPTLFKKMWKSHRSLWLLWFTMPCDPSYACFTLVYVKRNLTEYQNHTDDRLILFCCRCCCSFDHDIRMHWCDLSTLAQFCQSESIYMYYEHINIFEFIKFLASFLTTQKQLGYLGNSGIRV